MKRSLTPVAALLALASVALCLWGTSDLFERLDATELARLGLWMLLPIGASLVGLVVTLRRVTPVLWLCVGVLTGFVVLTGFSVGRFYSAAVLPLLGAAVVQLAARHRAVRLAVLPLWFLAGFSGLPAVLWLRDQMNPDPLATAAPAMVWGAGVFACVAVALALTTAWPRRASRRTQV